MPRMNEYKYVERRTCKNRGKLAKCRNWWLVKRKGGGCIIDLNGCIYMPKEYAGRRVRIRIEFIED